MKRLFHGIKTKHEVSIIKFKLVGEECVERKFNGQTSNQRILVIF